MKNYDLLVAGGGTAGVFAAISAARTGAKTILIEKNGFLGGTITSAKVNFPGLFFAWGKQIISGPCFEAILKTLDFANKKLPKISFNPEHHWDEQINIDIFTYVHIIEEMCISSGVELLYHTMVADVKENDEGVHILLTKKEGQEEVFAKSLVDATGDASCITLAGYPVEHSFELQPATLINDISGYDFNLIDKNDFDKKLQSAYENGILTKADTQGNALFEQLKHKRISMHLSVKNPETSKGKTEIEIEARNQLFRIISFLKTIKGLENVYVSAFGNECGIRESVRIIGEEKVTAEDYISGKKYENAICYSFYPIDLHVPEGIKQVFLKENVVPTIPMGALIPKNSKHLFVAGRCISSDRQANSALRVQATAMASGQAAGVMAVCNKSEVFDKLRELGAIVP